MCKPAGACKPFDAKGGSATATLHLGMTVAKRPFGLKRLAWLLQACCAYTSGTSAHAS